MPEPSGDDPVPWPPYGGGPGAYSGARDDDPARPGDPVRPGDPTRPNGPVRRSDQVKHDGPVRRDGERAARPSDPVRADDPVRQPSEPARGPGDPAWGDGKRAWPAADPIRRDGDPDWRPGDRVRRDGRRDLSADNRDAGAGRDGSAARGYGAGSDLQARRQGPVRLGSLPGRFGVYMVIGVAAIGGIISVGTGGLPGGLLGICLVAGTAAAAMTVDRRSVYLIIPVPALAYLVAAIAVGMIDDRAAGTSRTALVVSAAQWIGHGFAAMAAATALAVVVAALRWPWQRRSPRGLAASASAQQSPPARPLRRGESDGCSPSEPRLGPPSGLPGRAAQSGGARNR
jgi:hypothetical protein